MTQYDRDECFRKLAPEVKRFLERMNKVPSPPINRETYRALREFTNSMGRMQKTALDFSGIVKDRTIPGPGGDMSLRVYTPAGAGDRAGTLPVLLYFHGGGWIMADDLSLHDGQCAALAAGTPCIVVSLNYRLAPEHPYPAARDDCYAALRWLAENAHAIGGDRNRIAVGGESAGGNLAAVTALMSKDRGGPAIAFQLLIYPVTDLGNTDRPSHKAFGDGFFLSRTDMEGIRSLYAADENLWADPYVSPILAPDLGGLPPALIITAGCDPLRDEAEAYAKRLTEADVPADYVCFEDMMHAFLTFFTSSTSSKTAIEMSAAALREAFSAPGTG